MPSTTACSVTTVCSPDQELCLRIADRRGAGCRLGADRPDALRRVRSRLRPSRLHRLRGGNAGRLTRSICGWRPDSAPSWRNRSTRVFRAGSSLRTPPSSRPSRAGTPSATPSRPAPRRAGCTVHLATLEMDAGPILALTAGSSRAPWRYRGERCTSGSRWWSARRTRPRLAWALREIESGRVGSIRGARRPHGDSPSGERRGSGALPVPWATRAKTATVHAWRSGHRRPARQAEDRDHRRSAEWDHVAALLAVLSPRRGAIDGQGSPLLRRRRRRGRSGGTRSRFPHQPITRPTSRPRCKYMLYHRAGRGCRARAGDLPESTRFVALLRAAGGAGPPRTTSSSACRCRESETFARALDLEQSRLEGTEEAVVRGERSRPHRWYSYRSRGRYAGQLARWFDAVGRSSGS